MHWLGMFLLAWLSLGTATLAFLFWLWRRTAAAVQNPVKLGSLTPQRAEFGTNNLSSEFRSA
jgi:hypothetical protein